MTGFREVAEDLGQDVFVRAYGALPSYDAGDRDRA
jgi:DNA-directed RNA polymerase specialized sigma24 family protein